MHLRINEILKEKGKNKVLAVYSAGAELPEF